MGVHNMKHESLMHKIY